MGNEAPEAAGRSEVMPSVAYDEGESVCVCARETKTFHTNTAALREECRLVSLFGVSCFRFVFSLESVYFLL